MAGTIAPMLIRRPFAFLLTLSALLIPAPQIFAAPTDDNAAAVLAARSYVIGATRHHGDRVAVTVTPPASGVLFPPCFRHEVFLPGETQLWGKTRVGLRCSQPTAWSAFLAVKVSVTGTYLVSSRKINRGQTLVESDLEARTGDLTELPPSVLTSPRAAIGQRARVSLAAHQPLRRDHLIQTPVIRQGDKVRIIHRGAGFSAATDGVALNHAGEGDAIKVRTSAGRTLSGTARAAGEVELLP